MNINNSHPDELVCWSALFTTTETLEELLHVCSWRKTVEWVSLMTQLSLGWTEKAVFSFGCRLSFLQSLAKFWGSSQFSHPISLKSNFSLARHLLIRMTQAKGYTSSCLDTLYDADSPGNMLASLHFWLIINYVTWLSCPHLPLRRCFSFIEHLKNPWSYLIPKPSLGAR